VEIDWPKQFGDWLDRVEADANGGDARAKLIRKYVVVALFAGDKKRVGDIWYGSVASQADPLIDSWKREVSYDEPD